MPATRPRADVYQRITEHLLRALESPGRDLPLPWIGGRCAIPRNAITESPYRGINHLVLWCAAQESGYDTGTWATYKQWAGIGAQVRKGETSTTCVFYRTFDKDNPVTGETETRPVGRAFSLFNAAQVDHYTPPDDALDTLPSLTPHEQCRAFIAATGANIEHGGTQAYYGRATDTIHLPDATRFVARNAANAVEAHAAVALHETVHWTAHADRCNRDLAGRFGTEAYAIEELIAEIGAAFLCAELGVSPEPRDDHAQYLASWLQVLRNDRRAIFTAASAAEKACDFLRSLQPPPTRQPTHS